MENELNEMEKIIMDYLKKHKKRLSIKKLSENIEISYPSTLKYIETLKLKGKITIVDFGNVRLVQIKG